MGIKRHKPEEIVTKLRQVGELVSQAGGRSVQLRDRTANKNVPLLPRGENGGTISPHNPLISLQLRVCYGARGRNRTTDTRIFNPLLYP